MRLKILLIVFKFNLDVIGGTGAMLRNEEVLKLIDVYGSISN